MTKDEKAKPLGIPGFPPPNATRKNELLKARAERLEREKGLKKLAADATASSREPGQRAQAAIDAAAGKLPAPPDFSAPTHERFRPRLAELVKLVKAKDIAGLKAFDIKPVSTSPKAMDRYRNLAVIALEAKKVAAHV